MGVDANPADVASFMPGWHPRLCLAGSLGWFAPPLSQSAQMGSVMICRERRTTGILIPAGSPSVRARSLRSTPGNLS